MHRLFLPGVTLALLAAPLLGRSEPSPVARFLMQEKVSILDWGLYQIDEMLSDRDADFGVTRGTFHVSASYDWDSNRIRIYGWVLPEKALSAPTARSVCRQQLRVMRSFLGINTENGEPAEGGPSVTQFFRPASYESRDTPKNLEDEIQNMIELQVTISAPTDGGGFNPGLKCSGRLLSAEMLFAG